LSFFSNGYSSLLCQAKSRTLFINFLFTCCFLPDFFLVIRYFFWDRIKSAIIKHRLQDKFISKTDSLYTIEYDSLVFNEEKGQASMKNIRILPDTGRIAGLDPSRVPYVMLEIKVHSLVVRGVNTQKALHGNEMLGDTVIIESPVINAWFMKPVQKETRIDVEAQELYRQILGKLKLIKVNEVTIKNLEVHTFNFSDRLRQFHILNTDIHLHDVQIDSSSYADTSRILFCRDAVFNMANFTSYNQNREELTIKDILFNGRSKKLSFAHLSMSNFVDDVAMPFCKAENFTLTGVNTFEAFRHKKIVVDSIACASITLFKPRPRAFISRKTISKPVADHPGGFRHSYGVFVKGLYFPSVNLVESPTTAKPGDQLGRFFIHIRDINGDEIMDIQNHPFDHTGSAEIKCNEIAYTTNDGLYRHRMVNISFEPVTQKIHIQSYQLIPLLPEAQFMAKVKVQKDRYDIVINNIVADSISFDKLLKKEFVVGNIQASNSSIKIYRDVSRPLESKTKIGKYPQQALLNLDVPANIKKIDMGDVYLEYKEKNDLSGRSGTIRFEKSRVLVNNITNIPAAIKSDSLCKATLTSRVLGQLPLKAVFIFDLNARDGRFSVSGNLGNMKADVLNEITLPMAMMRIDAGYLDNADFNFTGDDYATSGNFVMKYRDLKVSLLKKNKTSGEIKKRHVMSFLANSILKDANPLNGELRNIKLEHSREPFKSFINLVWKTIYSGIQQTIGVAMPK